MTANNNCLTTRELAERWGMSDLTLKDYRAKKKGPPYIKFKHNGRIVYQLADIERFERENNMTAVIKENKDA